MDLGVQGNPWYPTPHIDAAARAGLRFTNYYAPSTVCSPSRAAMLSGLQPARTGITDFIPGHWRPYEALTVPTNRTQYLPREVETYAERLQGAGYRTGYFGKWHVGFGPDHAPQTQGFDTAQVQHGWGHFFPTVGLSPGAGVDSGAYLTDVLTDLTLDFIRDSRDEPFLAVLSHFAVHLPLEAPDEMIRAAGEREQPANRTYNPTYVAMLESVDRNFGRLMAGLDSMGLTERTLVIFTSDNGGLRQIYNKSDQVIATTNAPLRDEKGSIYEGGIRVPMFVRMPGTVRSGTTDAPATGLDLFPTFVEAAGQRTGGTADTLDGTSLWGHLTTGEALPQRDLYFHYPHYHHGRPAAALREGNWKVIRYFGERLPELYDLANDLGETNNLAALRPETAERLLGKLNAWLEEVHAPLPVANPDFDPQRREEWGPRPHG